MTGLLHRLAARASGTAWVVRSDARLPFGAGRLFEGEAAQEPQELQKFVAAAPDADAPMAGALQARPFSRPATPAAAPHPSAISALSRGSPAAMGNTQPASPPALLKPASAETAPVGAMAAGPACQHAPARSALHAAGVPAQPSAATSRAPEAPAAGRPAWSAASDDAAQPAHAPHWHGEPAPLLPPVRADASQPGTPSLQQLAAGRAPGAPQHPSSQDTEVHIHIGRIDVTAVHETPRPKARERERTQPVSLDAYLATRGAR